MSKGIKIKLEEKLNKELFTEYFNINEEQKNLEFVDIYINADKKFFLDPAKLLNYDDVMSIQMSNSIVKYFAKLLQFIRKEDKLNSLRMLSGLKEPKEIHLGYATKWYIGNAVGGVKGEKIYKKLSESNAVKTGLLKDLEESALLVEGINRDIISDMTVMITKKYLIEFTQKQCRKYQVPLERVKAGKIWDEKQDLWIEIEAELPVYNNKPMILVPKKIVTDKLMLDSQDFYRNELLSFVQDELMRADRSLIIVLKNGRRRCAVTKKQLKGDKRYRYSKDLLYRVIQTHPELLQKYRLRKKNTSEDIDEKLDEN